MELVDSVDDLRSSLSTRGMSMSNIEVLDAMILSKTTPTCSLSVFEMTIFRNSILSGTEYYCL